MMKIDKAVDALTQILDQEDELADFSNTTAAGDQDYTRLAKAYQSTLPMKPDFTPSLAPPVAPPVTMTTSTSTATLSMVGLIKSMEALALATKLAMER